MSTTRGSRLNTAFNYLKLKNLAVTKRDVSEKLNTSPPNISTAFNDGNNDVSDKFIIRFNNAYHNIFNISWLLDGVGEMLAKTDLTPTAEDSPPKKENSSEIMERLKESNAMLSQALNMNKEALDMNKELMNSITQLTISVNENNSKVVRAFEEIHKTQQKMVDDTNRTILVFQNSLLNRLNENKKDILNDCRTFQIPKGGKFIME